MNRKIAMSAVSVFSALAVMGGTTFAAFSSQNLNDNNTFGAGTMVLEINDQAPISTGVIVFPGAFPGDSFDALMKLDNVSTASTSSVMVKQIDISESVPGLSDKLILTFFTDTDGDGDFEPLDGETVIGAGALNDPTWANWVLPGVNMTGGGSYNLGAMLTFDPSADNTLQGATATFDITLQANQ